MPNWVTNSVQIAGPFETLEAFHKKFSTPAPEFKNKPDGSYGIVEGEWVIPEDDEDRKAFSFWNFLQPPEEKWGEYFSSTGSGPQGSYGDGEFNWYQWNTTHWGTKWDARDVEFELSSDLIFYRFETAWSPPERVFYAMSEQFPELVISVHAVEEQGWGYEAVYENGDLNSYREWDVPGSHSERLDVWGICHMCEEADEDDPCDLE